MQQLQQEATTCVCDSEHRRGRPFHLPHCRQSAQMHHPSDGSATLPTNSPLHRDNRCSVTASSVCFPRTLPSPHAASPACPLLLVLLHALTPHSTTMSVLAAPLPSPQKNQPCSARAQRQQPRLSHSCHGTERTWRNYPLPLLPHKP